MGVRVCGRAVTAQREREKEIKGERKRKRERERARKKDIYILKIDGCLGTY